ncbi:hypothetical protein [Aminipila terrae]|nr:hypothetical protein [Aminipila terrae]
MDLLRKGRNNKPGKYVKSSSSTSTDESTNRSTNGLKDCHKK